MPLLSRLKTLDTRTTRLVLGLLLLVTAARIGFLYPECTATSDEWIHIVAGLQIYEEGIYSYDLEHPPLARFAVGVLPYLSGVRVPSDGPPREWYVLKRAEDYWQALTLARIGNSVFLVILLLYVFRWSSLLYGRAAGLVAAFLVAGSPTVIAHSSVATIDLSITATLVAASYHAYRWFEAPSLSRALVTGLVSGLALIAKFSTVGFLPPIMIGFFLLHWLRHRTEVGKWSLLAPLNFLVQTSLFCAAALLVVWACWQICPAPPLIPIRPHYMIVDKFLVPDSLLNSGVNQLIVWARESMSGWTDGFWIAANHAYRGHRAQFLLGEIRVKEGWWYYFPVAFALKSTLPFLGLITLGIVPVVLRRYESLRNGLLHPVAAACVVLSVGIYSDLNIGIRHLLPMYPFLAVAASSLFVRSSSSFLRSAGLVRAAGLLLVLHGTASLAAHPDYLAYFNEIGRGREHHLLADSNLDWGQDIGRLGEYLRAHGITDVYVECFGQTRTPPETIGIEGAKRFPPPDQPVGWIAVSLTNLQGWWPPQDPSRYSWLLQHEPRAKIGKTIWLYYLEP